MERAATSSYTLACPKLAWGARARVYLRTFVRLLCPSAGPRGFAEAWCEHHLLESIFALPGSRAMCYLRFETVLFADSSTPATAFPGYHRVCLWLPAVISIAEAISLRLAWYAQPVCTWYGTSIRSTFTNKRHLLAWLLRFLHGLESLDDALALARSSLLCTLQRTDSSLKGSGSSVRKSQSTSAKSYFRPLCPRGPLAQVSQIRWSPRRVKGVTASNLHSSFDTFIISLPHVQFVELKREIRNSKHASNRGRVVSASILMFLTTVFADTHRSQHWNAGVVDCLASAQLFLTFALISCLR